MLTVLHIFFKPKDRENDSLRSRSSNDKDDVTHLLGVYSELVLDIYDLIWFSIPQSGGHYYHIPLMYEETGDTCVWKDDRRLVKTKLSALPTVRQPVRKVKSLGQLCLHQGLGGKAGFSGVRQSIAFSSLPVLTLES